MNHIYSNPKNQDNISDIMINVVNAMTLARRTNSIYMGFYSSNLLIYNSIFNNIQKCEIYDEIPTDEDCDIHNIIESDLIVTKTYYEIELLDKNIFEETFGISETYRSTIFLLYGDLSDFIAIDLRRFECIANRNIKNMNVLHKKDVYDIISTFFENEKKFILLSDDMLSVKDEFGYDERFVFADKLTNYLFIDLYIMSLTKGVVISNSTYSWVGAYLNNTYNSIIVCPMPWYRNKTLNNMKSFIPSNWYIWKRGLQVDLCCICNYYLEHEYIEEFLHYYIDKIGINLIHLYDDKRDSNDVLYLIPYVNQLLKQGYLDYVVNHDCIPLNNLYEDFYKEYKDNFDWCCFFDCDEFLCLPHHNSIQKYITDDNLGFISNNCYVILISWGLCGDNDYIKCEGTDNILDKYGNDYTLTNGSNLKIIIKGGYDNVKMQIGHCAKSNDNVDGIYYSNGTKIGKFVDGLKEEPNYDFAILKHLLTKSTEEFIKRRTYGRIDFPLHTIQERFDYYYKIYFIINKWTEQKQMIFLNEYRKYNVKRIK